MPEPAEQLDPQAQIERLTRERDEARVNEARMQKLVDQTGMLLAELHEARAAAIRAGRMVDVMLALMERTHAAKAKGE